MLKLTPWVLLFLVGAVGCKEAKKSSAVRCQTALPLAERSKAFCPEGQVCGSTGCRSCAGDSECSAGLKCCAGACTPGDSCPSCTLSQECRSGDVCCGGACTTGECCSAADCGGLACSDHHCATSVAKKRPEVGSCSRNNECPEGQACVAGSCAPCSSAAQCGADAQCCAGNCVAGECCSDGECGTGKCTNHSCQACVYDRECGAGQRCFGGGCVTGDCSTSAECSGRICRQNSCQACARSSQCAAGTTCCGGLCVAGSCCGDDDCSPGQVCNDRQCGACSYDLDCGPDKKCCGGACVSGECPAKAGTLSSRTAQPAPTMSCADGHCFDATRLASAIVVSCASDVECGLGGKCCNSVCVSGDCCADSQCPVGLLCLQNACQACTTDGMCGGGKVCCNGACATGSCCPGAPCPGGQVCSGFQCAACTKNTDCGSGNACCSGVCKQGNCCTNGDCGQYVCTASYCSVCVGNADCGNNSMCCGGACVAGATCCSRQDCPGGQTCTSNNCGTCAKDTDCGFGSKCCGGSCRTGNCCATADCKPGTVCNANNYCGSCADKSQCAVGQVCCGGTCLDGTCCTSADCGAGKVCTSNSCNSCTTNSECGFAQLCCNGTSPATPAAPGGCQSGNCCGSAECAGLICQGSLCTQCTGDAQCGANSMCCAGACYPGVTCCSSSDCGSLACLNGKCSSCTGSADCGGQQCCPDSNGVGRCQAFCSVGQTWSNTTTFNLGTYNGTATGDGGSVPPCPVGALCWAGSTAILDVPYIWIPASGEGTVYRYDTNTMARAGPFNTGVNANWPATPGTAPGASPSRTSVNPFDATLWIANRGDPAPSGGVAHLEYNGRMICYGGVPGGPRAVAIDAAGDVWVGSYTTRVMYKFSGTEVDPSSDPPACKLLLTIPIPGYPYGAAVDNQNHVWVQGSGNIIEIDASTAQILRTFAISAYGITVDKDYVWLTSCPQGCCSGTTCRLKKSNGQLTTYPLTSMSGISSTKNYVYTGDYGGGTYGRIDKNTGNVSSFSLPAPAGWTISAAVDSAGRVWAVDYGGPITRIDTNGTQTTVIGSTSGQYVYTDITGQQSINAGLNPGLWNIIYDTQYRYPRWQKINLTAITPPGTGVSVRVRTADTAAGLPSAVGKNMPGGWTDFLSTFPAILTGLNPAVPSKRFLELQIKLTTSSDQTTPVVSSISADWAP